MSGNPDNPRIWSTGVVNVAALGSDAPTDTDTALDEAFGPLGFLDEDNGIDEAMELSITDHRALGGDLVRVGYKGEKHTIKIWCLERNPLVQSIINPRGTLTVTSGVAKIEHKSFGPNPQAFVIDSTDGATKRRLYVAKADVAGPIEYEKQTTDSLAKYGITLACFVGSDGNWAEEWTTDPALV